MYQAIIRLLVTMCLLVTIVATNDVEEDCPLLEKIILRNENNKRVILPRPQFSPDASADESLQGVSTEDSQVNENIQENRVNENDNSNDDNGVGTESEQEIVEFKTENEEVSVDEPELPLKQ